MTGGMTMNFFRKNKSRVLTPRTVQRSRSAAAGQEVYAPNRAGTIEQYRRIRELVPIVDAAVQKLVRLTARRGGFLPMPEYGSRLYMLGRTKPAQRSAAALQYVLEALEPETEITVSAVEYLPGDGDGAQLRLELACGGEHTGAVLVL